MKLSTKGQGKYIRQCLHWYTKKPFGLKFLSIETSTREILSNRMEFLNCYLIQHLSWASALV